MNPTRTPIHAPAWVFFTYISFAASLAMLTLGIAILPIDLWMRAFLFMGMLMLVQSCITMTKTQRDVHESTLLRNRIEDAKTEKLLMEAGR
jgi:hypothetical protein